jgi:type VI secretion system secreted protein VgrG
MAAGAEPKFELEIDGVKPESLAFVSFRAEERLSECYRVDVDALSARLDPQALLGQKATLYVRFEGCPERAWSGVIWSAELTPIDEKMCSLRVQIVPRLQQLALGQSSRFFPKTTILAVVEALLEEGGLPKDAYDVQAAAGPEHEAIIQYAESDYDFMRRLLHEEGIGFLVQNNPDGEQVVLFDYGRALLAVEGLDTLVDRRRQDLRFDTAFDVREQFAATPNGVMLREYDVKDPGHSPDANAPEGDEAPNREVYEHPGGHLKLEQRAKRMLERLALPGRRFDGGSYWPHLEPGRHVQLESDLRASLSCELTLLAVEHEGHVNDGTTQAAYRNRFVACPKETPFRPQHAPPAPRLGGPQRAFVTGPRGQELYGDEFGRVKVRFPWDRSGVTDDKSSHFIRVGQPPMSGSMIIPRVGFEVLLGHEFGDVDRPYVAGHLYNDDAPTPYDSAHLTTSSIQTATTDGGAGANELRLGDSAGSEEMLMNASYDMSIKVENTYGANVTNDQRLEVGVDASLSVKGESIANVGGNRTLEVGVMQDINVGADYGDGVTGNHTVKIGATRNATIGGDQVESVAGKLSRTIGAAQNVLVVSGFTRKITGSSDVKVGAAWAETVAKSKSTTVSGARLEDVGAIKLISAKNAAIGADAAYGEKVKAQKVKTEKDRADSGKSLTVDAGSGLSVKADNITFTAEDQLTFSAGKVSITLKKTGEVQIKAKEVTIENSKALNQIMHKSN